MKRYLLLLVLLSLVLTGCLDSDITINVKKDGSGTIVCKTIVINTLDKEGASKAKKPIAFENSTFEKIASVLGRGVKLSSVNVDTTSRSGFIIAEAVYSFDDIRRVRLSPFVLATGAEDDSTYAYQLMTHFTFEGGDKSKLVIIRPRPQIDDSAKPTREEIISQTSGGPISNETLARAKKMFDENRLKFRVKVDGKITSTNASSVDSRTGTITLIDVDLDKLAEDKEKLRLFLSTVHYERFLLSLYHFIGDLGSDYSKFEEIRYDSNPKIRIEFK